MKRTYFHGTSADNLKSILRHGLNPENQKKIWTVSFRGVYLWSPDALVESGDTEEEYKIDYAKEQAYSSAQMGLAMSKSGKCVVFEIELDDSLVEPDQSCENMGGAVVCLETITPKQIKAVYVSPDLSLMKGYFIALCMGRDMFAGEFSRLERQIGEAFGKAEIYFEISDFPLSQMKVKIA